ncbi:MAG: L-2-amino-thiazoline-4-carboxylic acid hydrolase [Candidatus Hodarchaeota archaeon]
MPKPHYEIDEKTRSERSRIEDRALWLYFLFKEMESELGREKAEKIARKAIWNYGALKDDEVGNPGTPAGFIEKHARGSNPAVFEKEIPDTDTEEKIFRMHYCALKAAWEKIGASDEEIDLLCDIAMEGDKARSKGGLDIEVTKRMCDRIKKPDFCELIIRKRKD